MNRKWFGRDYISLYFVNWYILDVYYLSVADELESFSLSHAQTPSSSRPTLKIGVFVCRAPHTVQNLLLYTSVIHSIVCTHWKSFRAGLLWIYILECSVMLVVSHSIELGEMRPSEWKQSSMVVSGVECE